MCAAVSATTEPRRRRAADATGTSAVELWLVSLDAADAVSADDLTHAEDRARWDQIAVPSRKRQFAFRRRALRYVLGRYLPRYDLAYDPNGKPFVRTRPGRRRLHFSTSASRDVCVVCVGDIDTGVDVEASPPAVDVAGLVTQFVPGGRGALAAADDAANATSGLRAFRQHVAVMRWCRLEAYTKLHARTLHQVLFDEQEQLSEALGDGHHVVAVVNLDCVCVIAQKQPFRVSCIHQVAYARIAREQA